MFWMACWVGVVGLSGLTSEESDEPLQVDLSGPSAVLDGWIRNAAEEPLSGEVIWGLPTVEVLRAESDDSGYFGFLRAPAGAEDGAPLVVRSVGYQPRYSQAVQVIPEQPGRLSVPALHPGHELHGRVVDEQGQPVPGGQVLIYDFQDRGKLSQVHALHEAWTDQSGEFRLRELAAERHYLVVRPPDPYGLVTDAAVFPGSRTWTVGPGWPLEGTIKDAADLPMAGVTVAWRRSAAAMHAETAWTVTDEHGTFALAALPQRSGLVVATLARGRQQVCMQSIEAGGDPVLLAGRGATGIRVRLRDASSGLELARGSARVQTQRSQSRPSVMPDPRPTPLISYHSGQGVLEVWASSPGFQVELLQGVRTATGRIEDFEIALQPLVHSCAAPQGSCPHGAVGGRVVSEAGRPVQGASVRFGELQTVTGAEGIFSFSARPLQRDVLVVQGSALGGIRQRLTVPWPSRDWTLDGSFPSPQRCFWRDPAPMSQRARQGEPVVLRGRVLINGEPARYRGIEVFAEAAASFAMPLASGRTDAAGQYRLLVRKGAKGPALLIVGATESSSGWRRDQLYGIGRARLLLGEAKEKVRDFDLQVASVRLRLLDERGSPASFEPSIHPAGETSLPIRPRGSSQSCRRRTFGAVPEFTFSLSTGSYRCILWVSGRGHVMADVAVTSGTDQDIVLTMAHKRTLEVTLPWEKGVLFLQDDSGHDLAGGLSLYSFGAMISESTTAGFRFRVAGVQPGSYRVFFGQDFRRGAFKKVLWESSLDFDDRAPDVIQLSYQEPDTPSQEEE